MRSGLRQSLLLSRSFSTTISRLEQQYDYTKISNIIRSPSPAQKLIDVREPHEYKDGHIPTSINIPLSSFESTLKLPPNEFEQSLGFEKPKLEEEVVFYCKSGVRSTSASKIAEGLGYKAVGNYKGSWTDYSSRSSSSPSTPSADATSANAKRLFSTSARAFAKKAPNPNEKDGAGEGAAGGIDLKKMNQKEEKRAEGDKKQEKKSGNLAAAGEKESESVRSGADLAAGKKFE